MAGLPRTGPVKPASRSRRTRWAESCGPAISSTAVGSAATVCSTQLLFSVFPAGHRNWYWTEWPFSRSARSISRANMRLSWSSVISRTSRFRSVRDSTACVKHGASK